MRMKIASLSAFLLISLAQAQTPAKSAVVTTPTPSNAPIVKTGVQTVFNVGELTGDNAAKIVGSNKYQVSLIFPSKIQSVGINASKQNSVMATIDEYDGRVVYIDTLKPGGTATLNFRMLTDADVYTENNGEKPNPDAFGATNINPNVDPVILKMLIDLTDKDYGVLSYTIKKDAPKPVPVAVPKPTPAPAEPKPITPTPVATRPAPKPIVKPTTFRGTSPNGLAVTVSLTDTAKTQENQALSYKLEVSKKDDATAYRMDNSQIFLRLNNVDVKDIVVTPGDHILSVNSPVIGTIEIPKSIMEKEGAKVLMFTVTDKSDKSDKPRRYYIGVLLK